MLFRGTDGCDYPTVVSSVASLHRFSQIVSNHLRKVVFEADFRLIVKLSHQLLHFPLVSIISPTITWHISPLIRDLNFQSI